MHHSFDVATFTYKICILYEINCMHLAFRANKVKYSKGTLRIAVNFIIHSTQSNIPNYYTHACN